MDFDNYVLFFRKKIEPFIAIGILITLIILLTNVYNGNELRKEISQNCGWGEDDYRCFCEKSKAMEIKNIIENDFTFNVDEGEYVPIGG